MACVETVHTQRALSEEWGAVGVYMLNHPQSIHAPTIEVTLVHRMNTENCYCYYDFQRASLNYYRWFAYCGCY